jgi:hypothetical protein
MLRRADLEAVAQRNWPWYALAWIFPLLLLVYIAIERVSARSTVFERILVLTFFLSFSLAQVPRFLGRANFHETAVLGMLVPFFIWVIGAVVLSVVLLLWGS